MNSKKKFLNSLGIWGIIGIIILVIYLIGKYSNFLIVPHVIFFLIPFAFIYTISPLIHAKKPFLIISNDEIKYFGDFRFNIIQLNNIKSYMIDIEKSFLHIEVVNSKEPISINLSEIIVAAEDIEIALKEVLKTESQK